MNVNKQKIKSSTMNSRRFATKAATTAVISELNNKIMYTDRDNNHSFVMNMMNKKDSLKNLVNEENPNWNALKSIYQ